MAITVKHSKVSTIPDGDDSSLIRPSDWNDDHVLDGTVPVSNGGTGASTLTGYVKGNGTSAMTASTTIPNTDVTGLGTMSTQNANNVTITGGSISGATVSGYIPTTEKAQPLGVATLDAGGKVPVSQIPQMGDLNYQGTWNASTNTPTLTSSTGTKGYYYVVSVAGTTNLNGITDWQVGDWAVYNGTAWQKIDNTDAVTSVNGYTGTVVLTASDIGGLGTMATQNANSVAITGGAINGTTIGASSQADITGNTINAFTKFVAQDYYAQSILGGNLRTSGGTSLLNWDGGGSGNISVNGGLTANPSNKNVSLSPTGTGSVTINPATAGAIDNMVIGATTPKAITGTTITGTSFVGSGASLTNVVNSLTASTGISVSGSTGAVTVTNTAPDQTVVLTAGTGISTSGTYPNFTITNTSPSSGGTVTSITAGTGLTGGTITSSGTIAIDSTVTTNSGIQTLTNKTISGASNTLSNIGNSSLTNSSITINGSAISLGGSVSVGTVTSVSGTTGRITSTGGATPIIDLASGIATAGTTGSSTLIPVITIDTYGRVTSITTASNPQGTVTSVNGTGTVSGITLSGTVTSSGNLTLGGTLDLSSPPAIGGTTANAITGTTITATRFVGVSGGTF